MEAQKNSGVSFIAVPSSAPNRIESLHSQGHPIKAVVLTTATRGTHCGRRVVILKH
jgi:hypothetical protein